MTRVTVNEGNLEGEVIDSTLGFKYHSFKGIPYAEPPVGNLRFRAPQSPKSWTGIRSAKEHGPVCIQYEMFLLHIVTGSEDCLYLNVYTKDVKPTRPLPVMVWIHGGGFVSGSGNSQEYGPDFLVEKDVILVTINYRLEVMGFLSLDIEEVPGNAGMKDQVAALRWVKNNIKNFGGDPENITIFGESAGGASVSFHLVSPMSKGLFKRAISQSGACTNHWANADELREKAFTLGRQLGKVTDNEKELLEFLRSQPAEKLVNIKPRITFSETEGLYWAVSEEKQFGNNERFFYENCYDTIRKGIHEGVDVIVGYNKDEGLMTAGLIPSLDAALEKANIFLESFVPKPIAWNCSLKKQLEVGRKIKEFYFNKEAITRDNLKNLIRFYGMDIFVFNIIQFAKIASKKNNIYLYKFKCATERNIFGPVFCRQFKIDEDSVCHADDLMYMFLNQIVPLPLPIINSKSYNMIDKVTTLWTNFAKFGNPTPDNSLGARWPPYSVEKQEYLVIDEKLEPKTFPENEEIEFWESIFKQYLPEYCA